MDGGASNLWHGNGPSAVSHMSRVSQLHSGLAIDVARMLSEEEFQRAREVEKRTCDDIFLRFGMNKAGLFRALLPQFIPCTRGSVDKSRAAQALPHYIGGTETKILWAALVQRTLEPKNDWVHTINFDDVETFLTSKIKEGRQLLRNQYKLNFGFITLQPFKRDGVTVSSGPPTCLNHNLMYFSRAGKKMSTGRGRSKPAVPVIGGYYRGHFCFIPTLKRISMVPHPHQNKSYVIVVPPLSNVDSGTHHKHDSRKDLLDPLKRLESLTITNETKQQQRKCSGPRRNKADGSDDSQVTSNTFHLMCLLHFRLQDKNEERVLLELWCHLRLLQVIWMVRRLRESLTAVSLSS